MEKKNIPSPLTKSLMLFASASIMLAVFSIIFITSSQINEVGIAGLILSAVIAVYWYVLLKKFCNKKYVTVDGICTDARAKGILRHKTWQVIIEDLNSKDTYSFSTSFRKKHRILPGDRLYIYLPDDNMVVENDGVLDIMSYYGYEIHR